MRNYFFAGAAIAIICISAIAFIPATGSQIPQLSKDQKLIISQSELQLVKLNAEEEAVKRQWYEIEKKKEAVIAKRNDILASAIASSGLNPNEYQFDLDTMKFSKKPAETAKK